MELSSRGATVSVKAEWEPSTNWQVGALTSLQGASCQNLNKAFGLQVFSINIILINDRSLFSKPLKDINLFTLKKLINVLPYYKTNTQNL